MFAFASGAGLMGEAGPEAIMPLKRTQNGRLGVELARGATSQQDDAKLMGMVTAAVEGHRRTLNQSVNVTIAGRPDRRTPEQIARASGREASRALARTGR